MFISESFSNRIIINTVFFPSNHKFLVWNQPCATLVVSFWFHINVLLQSRTSESCNIELEFVTIIATQVATVAIPIIRHFDRLWHRIQSKLLYSYVSMTVGLGKT